jgi:hypothetical protein
VKQEAMAEREDVVVVRFNEPSKTTIFNHDRSTLGVPG